MRRAITPREAAALVPDGASVMVSGPLPGDAPERLIDALLARRARRLTVIAMDPSRPGAAVGRLVAAGCVTRLVLSRLEKNSPAQRKMMRGELAVELNDASTLVERIRAGGLNLGGVLLPTAIARPGMEGHQRVEVGGVGYTLQPALRADFALLQAEEADGFFNLGYAADAAEIPQLMALAADRVIAAPDSLLDSGALPPGRLGTSGLLVDYLVPATR